VGHADGDCIQGGGGYGVMYCHAPPPSPDCSSCAYALARLLARVCGLCPHTVHTLAPPPPKWLTIKQITIRQATELFLHTCATVLTSWLKLAYTVMNWNNIDWCIFFLDLYTVVKAGGIFPSYFMKILQQIYRKNGLRNIS
jgi:hypothetical protein